MCPRGRPRGQGRPRGLHLWYSPSVHFCPGSYSFEVVNVFITRSALNH